MSTLASLPELQALDTCHSLVRIPPELDVPLTVRVRRLIDTAAFRRLARISQLGLVALVYPAAHHTRFEHSLGVYRLALVYLRQLARDERFRNTIDRPAAERLVVAALLHDLGHWPFCHPIEDIRLPGVPHHEQFARAYLESPEVAEALRSDWDIEPGEIAELLAEQRPDTRSRILRSLLSGPIDIDKLDYLTRDSLHAGVPYGRHFDQQRLVGSLCLNATGDALALSEKGKTAAEMMVFARYVMFSEVYWHHAVRGATAMFQRAFSLLHGQLDLESLFRLSEAEMIERMQRAARNEPAGELLDGLFGPQRRLYKRLAQFSLFEEPQWYERLARRPYPWLVDAATRFAAALAERLEQPVAPHEVLFDAPPAKREVEFRVDIYFTKERCYRPLGEVSPVVQTLALRQFDDYVKRVRIFIHPRLARAARDLPDLSAVLASAIGMD
ncbi:MAG: HD domain-containing protein [Pirellulales bacterium]